MGLLFFLPGMDPTGRERVRCINLTLGLHRHDALVVQQLHTKGSLKDFCLCFPSLKLRLILLPGSILKSHPSDS